VAEFYDTDIQKLTENDEMFNQTCTLCWIMVIDGRNPIRSFLNIFFVVLTKQIDLILSESSSYLSTATWIY